MDEESLVTFVERSGVRRTVLLAVVAERRSGPALVADLAASKSGVYKALNELSDHTLVAESAGAWAPTAAGRLVADALERHDRLESLLADREYWSTHDITDLPEHFRQRLSELADVTILRNPENDPRYLEQYWVERMPDADRLWVGSRVIHRPYAEAMDDQAAVGGDARLIIHGPVLDQFLDQYEVTPEEVTRSRPETIEQRVCDIPCSFMLTGDLLTLSFPTHDGEYDQDSVVVCRGETALRFGRDFFSYYWERSEPIASYVME